MKKRLSFIFGGMILFLLGIVPYIWAAMYTLPGIDDISVAIEIRNTEGDYITKVISHAIQMYFTWEGRYFSNILMGAIRPYDTFGIDGLRIYTVAIILLFCVSIILMLYIILKGLCQNVIGLSVLFGLILLFLLFNVNNTVEFFYYNIVIHVYTVPFMLGGLSLAYMIKCFLERKYGKRFFVSMIFGAMAVGTTQQISAILCYIALLLVVKSYKTYNKIFTREFYYFTIVFIGACINAFAPGNFVRADNDSVLSFFSLAKAIFNSFYIMVLELRHIVVETYFPFYAVLFFLFLHFIHFSTNEGSKLRVVNVLIHTVIVSAIGIFPIALGHNSAYMDNRNITILDFEIIVGILLSEFVYHIRSLSNESSKKNTNVVLIIVVLGMICFNQNYDFTDQPSIRALHQLSNGMVQQYSEDMDVVLNYLEKTSGDVEVPYIHCEQGVINKLEFSDDPDYWVNKCASEYFGVNSIRLNTDNEVNDLRLMGY